ncbi:MAG TPA: proline racemase family protein [Bacillota bacterium]|nr:proline racemase family protein [Bacillota bacterium]
MNIEKMYSTIDTHVAGEAFRIVLQSTIVLNEDTIRANNEKLQTHFQAEKSILLKEPRGHRDMHGCIVVPSDHAHFGLLFFNHDDNIQFKYSGLVATLTALLETGNLQQNAENIYTIETVAGIFQLHATIENNEVIKVTLATNQCSIHDKGEYKLITVDEKRDYLLFELPKSIEHLKVEYLSDINAWGKQTIKHFSKSNRLEGIIVIERDNSNPNKVRSLTYERDGTILRSPGYDTTLGLLSALQVENKSITNIINTSIFNSHLEAKLDMNTKQIDITSEAFVTGIHQFVVDSDDPLHKGFLLK